MSQQITVIGSIGHVGAECFLWDQEFPNLTECDAIIVNLPSLNYAALDLLYGKLGQSAYNRKMIRCQTQISQFLDHGRPLFAIVDLPVSVASSSETDITNMQWLPFGLDVTPVSPSGKRFAKAADSGMQPVIDYLKILREYRLEIGEISLRDRDIINRYFKKPKPKSYSLLNTHGGYRVASGFIMSGASRSDDAHGLIIALHPLDSTNQKAGIDAIVNALLGSVSHHAPADIDQIIMPGESTLNQKIEDLNARMATITQECEQMLGKRSELRSFVELLYEYGEPLDSIVRRAFTVLGLSTKKLPGRAHKEDFIICTDGRNVDAVVEVTGVEAQVNVKKARQLIDWMLSSEASAGAKGILVGNHYRNSAVGKSPEAFTEDAIRAASGMGICLISSEILFKAVCAQIDGRLNKEEFVHNLLSTTGVFDFAVLQKHQ